MEFLTFMGIFLFYFISFLTTLNVYELRGPAAGVLVLEENVPNVFSDIGFQLFNRPGSILLDGSTFSSKAYAYFSALIGPLQKSKLLTPYAIMYSYTSEKQAFDL